MSEPSAEPRDTVFSFKITKSMDGDIDTCGALTHLGRSGLTLSALEAVIAACKRDGGIVVPVGLRISRIEFEVDRVPGPAPRKAKAPTPEKLLDEAKRRQAARASSDKRAPSHAAAEASD